MTHDMEDQTLAARRRSGRYLVGLIGEGISASLTPTMHEVEGRELGLDYEYRVLDLIELRRPASDVEAMLREAQSAGFAAVNITYPCKQLVLDLVDDLHPDAAHLRAVNLVIFDDGHRIGYNTDWMGYRDALTTGLRGASLDRVVQIGCGGAGAATAYALLSEGARRVDLSDADPDRSAELAVRMRELFPGRNIGTVAAADLPAAIAAASGVVHATPLGMFHHPGIAFDLDLLAEGAWVSDIVYRPLDTQLIRGASERGHQVLDGGRMAVGQAFASLQIITGLQPDRERMRRHFRMLVNAEDPTGAGRSGP